MREVIMSNVGAINTDKLDGDIRAVCPRFAGLTRRKDRTVLYLLFEATVVLLGRFLRWSISAR